MEFYFLVDIGWIVVMIVFLFIILGGGASALAGFIANHIPLLIIIGIVLLVVQCVAMWFWTKRIWVVLLSAFYPTQFYFYIIRGVYGLSLIVFTDHPIKFILMAFLYFVYGLINFCGLCACLGVTLEYATTEEKYVTLGEGALIVLVNVGLGLLGWFINLVTFPM